MFNLIRNAVEAMIGSPVRLLTISSAAAPAGFVTVAIEDSGAGIAPELADKLFQPFLTSKKAGMGIGLSLCRTIVEAQGGRIWFESSPDSGTVFRFTLPTGGEIDDEF